jgi:hypothetical protein
MLIDCDACQARGPACGDCVVTVLLGTPAPRAQVTGVELDSAEQAAIAVLAQCGLIPPLRLVPAAVVETVLHDEDDDWGDPALDGGLDTPHHRVSPASTRRPATGSRRGVIGSPGTGRTVEPSPDQHRDVS